MRGNRGKQRTLMLNGEKNVKYIECCCVYLAKQTSAVVSVFCTVQSCYSEFPTQVVVTSRGFIGSSVSVRQYIIHRYTRNRSRVSWSEKIPPSANAT